MTGIPPIWWQTLAAYTERRVLSLLLLGFSAGLPYLLVFSTLSAWLSDYGVSRTTIGFFSLVGTIYSIKVIWAPVVDRLQLPILTRWLGQRRAWMLLGQLGIVIGLLAMSQLDVTNQLISLALVSLLVAFSSATQDVSLDAYRIEAAEVERQAILASSYILGYRVGLLVAGAGAFYIAEFGSWALAYISMAALGLVGVVATVFVAQPVRTTVRPGATDVLGESASVWRKFRYLVTDAVVKPFVEFYQRSGRYVWFLLLLISLYRLSDITMGVMANVFYLDLGFSKVEIGSVVKVFGFGMTIFGAVVGGLLVLRYGLMKILCLGAVLVAATNLLFASLAAMGEQPSLAMLAGVISADNFSGGLANVAFIAFLSSLTSREFTATQYALFSSLMTLPGKVVGSLSGVWVDAVGFTDFFIGAACLGLPAIVLVVLMMVWQPDVQMRSGNQTNNQTN